VFDDLEKPWDNISTDVANPQKKTKAVNQSKGSNTMTTQVIEGIANFSHVTEHDVFNGQSTGAYSITLTMDEEDANQLAAAGVKIKDYQGNKQRKFKSKFDVTVVDANGDRYHGEIPYNSKIRVKYKLGKPHPVHGVSTYLEAIKVLEEAEMPEGAGDF